MSEVRSPYGPAQGFRDTTPWYMGLSAYWFATSFKWFILLLVVIPAQVSAIVPGGTKGTYWGLVVSIGAVWAMVGPSIFGYLSDRLGGMGKRKPFIAMGAGLTVVALALLSGANQIWIIVLGFLLLQISDDLGTGPYSALIPELVPEDRRGRASGFMGLFTTGAQVFAGVTAFILGANWQAIYITIGLVNVVCAGIVLYTLRDVGAAVARSAPTGGLVAGFIKGWIDPWKSRDFFWVWFTRFLNAFGFYLVVTYLQYYLGDTLPDFKLFGLDLSDSKDPASAARATSVLALSISLFGVIGALWATKAADRIGRKKVIYLSGVLMAAAIVPAALVHNLTFIWSVATVFGIGYGMYLSADWALVSDILPNKSEAGTEMGVWQMSVSVVQIFTGLAGRLVDAGNASSPGMGYTVAFMIAAVAFLASTVLVRQIKGSS